MKRDPVVRAFLFTALALGGSFALGRVACILHCTRPLVAPGATTGEVIEHWGESTEIYTSASMNDLLQYGVVLEVVGGKFTPLTLPLLGPTDEARVYGRGISGAVILCVRDGKVQRVFTWDT